MLLVVYGMKRVITCLVLKPGHRRGLGKALLGQRGLVVDEVPVGAADEADVGLQDQHAAAGLQQLERHAQLLEHGLRRGQVLEVVAEEREVEVVVRQDVGQVQSAGSDEADVRRQRRADVADVGRPALGRADVADEVSEIARDVDDARAGSDVALKVATELAPDGFLARLVGLVEALLVDLFEDDRRRLVPGIRIVSAERFDRGHAS